MSSFYGGKQGRTYHIVQRYDSVAQMVDAFSGGGAYSDVNYGLYVIIDTILNLNHKSDSENGLLYRRGFDYNDSSDLYPKPTVDDVYLLGEHAGEYKYKDANGNLIELFWQIAWSNWVEHPGSGAIYVGQIVGPQGDSPDLIPVSWEELKLDDDRQIRRIVPTSMTKGTDNTPVYNGDGTQMEYLDGEAVWYGDLIKTATTTLRDNLNNVTDVQIAFDIPQNVFLALVVNTNPYLTSTVYENPASTAHPFYYKWDFEIPRGIHGQDLTAIVKENGSSIDNSSVDGLGNPIVTDDEYLTYTITNYNSGQPGDSDAAAAASTAHLGRWPYRVINEIEPVLKIRENLLNLTTWVTGLTVNIGDLYREDNYPDDIYWVCVKSGTITNSNDRPKIENATIANLGFLDNSLGNGMIWRVVNIPETAPAHSLNVDYKAGPNDLISGLRNIDYLSFDKDGKMYVFYADSEIPYYLTTIRSILNLYYDSLNGVVRIKYYGQEEEDLYNPKVIKRVSYNTGLLQPQEYQVHYDDGSFDTVSERTNVIAATRRLGDNLLFLYSDPNMRASIPEEKRVTFNEVWTDTLTGSTYAPNSLVWYNFGPLGAQYHVQGVYSYSDLIEGGQLEHGFDHVPGLEDRAGWLVTVITELEVDGLTVNVPRIYAFDYTELNGNPTHIIPDGQGETVLSHWYEVMSLTAAALNPNMFIAASTSQPTTLSDNGFWFVVSYGHDQEAGNG